MLTQGAATPNSIFYDNDAETSVLGASMLMPRLMPELSLSLKPTDFWFPGHKLIWQAILELDAAGQEPDPILLSDLLDKKGKLEAVGGRAYIHSLTSLTGSASNAPQHAHVIQKHSTNRKLHRLIMDVQAAQGKDDPAATLSTLQDALAGIENETTKDIPLLTTLLHEHWEHLETIAACGQHIAGVSTGFPVLDQQINGLMPANLVIVASRPSMGKTAFALSLLATVAAETRKPGLMFSLEMAQIELTSRLISSHSRIPGPQLLNAQLTATEWERAAKAHADLAELPLFIDDTPGLEFGELRAKARRLHRRKPLSILLVDYLQLMTASGHRDNREQEVAEISKNLKNLSKELNIPVVALAQLNRSCEARQDKRPMLSDLRESGGIEQDADLVLMLYRDDYYTPDSPTGEVEILNRKNRHGPTGTVKLAFQQQCGRFANMGQPYQRREQYGD